MNLRTLFLAIPLLSSGITVHADTFDMSYSFTGTGDVLSGTFTELQMATTSQTYPMPALALMEWPYPV